MRYHKITRKEARLRFESGQEIILCPSKFYPAPSHPFNMSCPVKINPESPESFDSVCNGFRYYNCTKETGKRVTFYVTNKDRYLIEFVGDNAQYIQRGSRDGFLGPVYGIGDNEVEAKN